MIALNPREDRGENADNHVEQSVNIQRPLSPGAVRSLWINESALSTP
jgi:hypothetical protein